MVEMRTQLWTEEGEFRTWGKDYGGYQPYIVRQLHEYREEMKYKLSKLPIGLHSDDPDRIFYMNLKKSSVVIILGKKGAGKTSMLSGMIDRIHLTDDGRVFNVDMKGEYIHKYLPLQKHFHKFILKNEIPQALKIKSYYPYFFKKFVERKLVKDEQYIQFSLQDMNKFDFLTLLNITDERGTELINSVWDKFKSKSISTWEEAMDIVNKITDVHHFTKRKMQLTMKNLIDSKVIGDEVQPPDIIENINDGFFVNLNLKGMMQYSSFSNPASTYLAIILRQIYNAKVFKKLKRQHHHFVVIDELSTFAPNIGTSSSKHWIEKLVTISRQEGISVWMSTQDYKKIPDVITKQADYIFLPYNVDLDDAANIIRRVLPGEYKVPQTFKSRVGSEILDDLKIFRSGRRDWLCLDRVRKKYFCISPFLPLSHLTEEGENL